MHVASLAAVPVAKLRRMHQLLNHEIVTRPAEHEDAATKSPNPLEPQPVITIERT
jgi:hypothetical protein